MGLDTSMQGMCWVRLPRVSGDGPVLLLKRKLRPGVAPRERGWAQARLVIEPEHVGCPA